MRYKNKRRIFRWIFIWSHLQLVFSEDVSPIDGFSHSSNDGPMGKDLRGLFSPRMDYDQWKPLGRGDPLKNDPTYDYVPPVLDRVHYWIDPALRKPDPPVPVESPKTEILLLGVSSKKSSTGSSIADSRKDVYDSFLQFVDGPKFTTQRNTRPHFPMTSYFPQNYYTKNKISYNGKEQRVPYTMLMPPPLITKSSSPVSPSPVQSVETIQTTTESVTLTTTVVPDGTTVTPKPESDVTVQTANLVFHSSSLSNSNEWKTTETSTNLTPNPSQFSTKKVKPMKEIFQNLPEHYMQIHFAPMHNLTNEDLLTNDHSINFVTPPPLSQPMHKGQVSDDSLDISNTYVKIGKTEAQVHSTAMDNIPILPTEMLMGKPPNMMVFSPQNALTQNPITMQTIQNMQSMQPPPPTTSPFYKKTTNPIKTALEKEKIETLNDEVVTAATTSTTIPVGFLTTDPIAKHLKPATEIKKNSLYLIIQGHSKVKTYGPSKQYHGIMVQETNEISDEKEEVSLKHLHSFLKTDNKKDNLREARSGNLQTLKHVIQSKLGAIDFGDVDEGMKETELHFGYKVGGDATSEKYHKGIVEEARRLHMEA